MILYLNKVNNELSFTDNNSADYQMIISRIKSVNMKVNKKQPNGNYKEVPISSKEVKELNQFVLQHFSNVVKELNSLIES